MDKQRNATKTTPDTTGTFLQYGGQAVIEGVMMRSPRYFAVACRKPDGSIVVQCEEVDKSVLRKLKWLNKPFLRGTLALVDAMVLGTRALAFASNVQMEAEQRSGEVKRWGGEEEEARSQKSEATPVQGIDRHPTPDTRHPKREATPAPNKINDIAIKGTIATSFVFGIGLFVLIPTMVTGFLKYKGLVGAGSSGLNIMDGLIRMAIFFGYIGLISFMSQIQAVFQYHGAEHKAINTLEAGLELNAVNALQASRIHPRCGTSFIFIVLVINLMVFAVLPRPEFFVTRFLLHVAVIPIVAGIAYEIIKFAGKFRHNRLIMAIFAPGMWTQYITTREPKPDQVEVALAALYSVLEAEGHRIPETAPLPLADSAPQPVPA